jgi:hypothetical protein
MHLQRIYRIQVQLELIGRLRSGPDHSLAERDNGLAGQEKDGDVDPGDVLPLPVSERVVEMVSMRLSWTYPEVADNFSLRHRNLLHSSLLVVRRAQVA